MTHTPVKTRLAYIQRLQAPLSTAPDPFQPRWNGKAERAWQIAPIDNVLSEQSRQSNNTSFRKKTLCASIPASFRQRAFYICQIFVPKPF
jgi:hypothetical protein